MSKHLAGMTLPAGQVRNVRSYARFGTRPVELVTSDPRGDLYEGDLRVPQELCKDMKDVQLKHRREQYIARYINRWVDAREHGALYPHHRSKLTSQPKVSGPFKAPVDNPEAESPDWVVYRVQAHFKPQETVLAGLTEIAEIERKAKLYGVNLWEPRRASNRLPRTKRVINQTTPFDDPMQVAEARRQALGVKREDYLLPEHA